MNLNYNPWKIKFLSLSSLSLSPQVITGQAASRLTGPAAQVKTVRARVCKPHVTYRRSTGQDQKNEKNKNKCPQYECIEKLWYARMQDKARCSG